MPNSNEMSFIPVCEPTLSEKELEYVTDAVRSGWISSAGRYVNAFEEAFSKYCGVPYGVSCTSGTTALHLALLACDLQPGDEVILPNFTMVATLNAVLYCGAKPVFVDVEPDTWNIDVKKLKLSKKTKAIMPVHLFGQPCDMDEIMEAAKSVGAFVVEDAAQAHGAAYKGRIVGGIGDFGCFSFFSNKIITTGEGGMVVARDEKLVRKLKSFRNLCFKVDGPRDYWHEDCGYNYRLTNIQAAIGLAQFESIDTLIKNRQRNADVLRAALSGIPGLSFPQTKPDRTNVYWMNAVCIDPKEFGMSCPELLAKLKENGIDTRILFKPMNRQPFLKKYGIEDRGDYPVTEWLAENGFYLPSSSHLKPSELARIGETVAKIQKGKK